MSANFSRHQYRQRYVVPHRQAFNENDSSINKTLHMMQIHHRRAPSIFSFYDNYVQDEGEASKSKWAIVRQRLPDILALSPTYRPKSIRSQLVLLVTLMHRQSNQLRKLSQLDYDHEVSCIPPSVIINSGGRNRLIYLKHIPPQQMVYVDVDGLSFSIPARQFIIAISRGDAHKTAIKFCPPAITDMLINLSKKKVVDDGRQYQRTLFRMRVGKILFYSLFIFIIGMILTLTIGAANTLFRMSSFNYTTKKLPIPSYSSYTETDEYSQ